MANEILNLDKFQKCFEKIITRKSVGLDKLQPEVWKTRKLVHQFTYLGSNISSTESDDNIHLAKVWTAISRLSIIWKYNLAENKTGYLLSCACISITLWMHHLDANEMQVERARWKLQKNASRCLEQILEATPHKTAAVGQLTTHLTNHPSKTKKTCMVLLEKQRQTQKWPSRKDICIWACQCWLTSKVLLMSILCEHWMLSKRLA